MYVIVLRFKRARHVGAFDAVAHVGGPGNRWFGVVGMVVAPLLTSMLCIDRFESTEVTVSVVSVMDSSGSTKYF